MSLIQRYVIRSKRQPEKVWATFCDRDSAVIFFHHMMDRPELWELHDTKEVER